MMYLHDPANVQQTSSICIQNTLANAGRLLDRVNTLLGFACLSVQLVESSQQIKLR